jgi:hypothetical protein
MLRVLGRLLLVPIAFLLAATAAGFVILSLGQERIVHAMAGKDFDADTLRSALELLRLAVAVISLEALLPSLLLIIVGEVARIRSATYYVLGGGAALALVPLLARAGGEPAWTPFPSLWQLLATAGFAGGFVYWLLAGRNA